MHARIMERVRGTTSSAPRSTPGLYYFFAPQFMAPVAALLVVVLGGGTAYAAQGSLPGDALYTIKVSVSEPVMGALAFSTEDKIKFHTEAAQTRLEEAEVLASQDRLDASAAAMIESNLDKHLAKRTELAAALDAEDLETSVEVSARLDSSIAAHGDVLAALGDGSSNSTTRENSNALASKVRSARSSRGGEGTVTLAMAKSAAPIAPDVEAPEPMATTMSLTASQEDSSDTAQEEASSSEALTAQETSRVSKEVVSSTKQVRQEKNALSLGARATSTLKNLKEKVQAMDDVDAETQELLDACFFVIESLITQGNISLAEKDFESATRRFNEALEREVKLSTFIAANQKFNHGILKNLLERDSSWGDDGVED